MEELEFPRSSARVSILENGLEIIVCEDSSAPVVSLQFWCRAGSIHEGEWLGAGMSHFLEHMLFKGTEKRDANEVALIVQENGGYINAYTSFDRTVYWIDAPSEGWKPCLEVLCDTVGFAQLPEDEFEKEREVIRREIAMGEDNPEQVISKLLFRTAYSVHPCRHPVIGHLDLFNQLSRDDLYQYYRENYSPDNLFVVVAGDIRAEEVKAEIEQHLGGLDRRRGEKNPLRCEPPQVGIRREEIAFPTDLTRLKLGWPIVDATHRDVPALDLLGSVVGGGKSSRLVRSIKEEKQLAHRVSAYSYTPSFDGIFAVGCETEPEKQDATFDAVLEELNRVRKEGVGEDELEKVKRQSLSAQFSTLTDMRGIASDLGSNWILTRNLDYTRDYVDLVQKTGTRGVREVAERYLTPETFSYVSLVPEGVEKKAGAKHRPARSEDIRKIELENGLSVLLLADKRVPFVQANGFFRAGLLAETPVTNGITRLTGRLLVKDTDKRSAEEVAESIESVGGGISPSFGNNTFGVAVGALKTDLPLVVDLLGDALLSPRFLDEAVSREKAFQTAQIKSELDRPFSVAVKRLRKEIYGDHPYGLEPSGTVESVAGLNRDQLTAFRQELIVGNNGVVGVFGDLDMAEAEDLVREAFSERLQAGEQKFDGSGDAFSLPNPEGEIVEITHEKEQAILLVGYRTVNLLHEDNPALEIIDEACSDMASRMFVRIREELGLAYSVGASRILGLEPGSLIFYVATSPEKLDLVQSNLLDEIYKIANEGLEPEEFERARNSWLGREAIHLQGAKELANVAVVDELVGLGWDNYRKAPDHMKELTVEDVQAVAKRYIREDNQVIVRLTTA